MHEAGKTYAQLGRTISGVAKKSALASAWMRGDDLGGLAGRGLARPFAQSVWVQRAIKKVSGPIAAMDLRFDSKRGVAAMLPPDVEDYWADPAVGMSRVDFIEASIGWLKLTGEFFWILDDSALVPAGARKLGKIILARPDRMRHVVVDGRLVGWLYRDGSTQTHALLPEQVIQVRNYNPYDDFRGLGEFEAAQIAAEADYAASKFVRNLSQNNGDQGVYLVAKNGLPSDEQREQIIMQLREKRVAQQRGEFRPMFISGDITVEDPKIAAPNGDFANIRLQHRHEIFLAFGVPPSMADKTESYSVGSASDWFILIFETCIPTSGKVASGVDQVIRLQTGERLISYFDFDEHPVMQAVRRERLSNAKELWAMGMPMRDINDYLRLGIKPFRGWDKGFLPFSVAAVDELPAAPAPAPVDPNFSEPDDEDAKALFASLRRTLETPIAPEPAATRSETESELSRLFDGVCCAAHETRGDAAGFQSSRPSRERAQWREHMTRRLPVIRAYESRVNKLLFDARAEVLAKLDRASRSQKSLTRAAAADFMFDLQGFAAKLQTAMRSVAKTALQTAGEQFLKEVKLDDPFSMPAAEVAQFLAERENNLKGVPQEVFDQVKDNLQAGIDVGDTMQDLAKRVRQEFNDMSKTRSTRIAMTETAVVYGKARQVGMEQAGIQWKSWLTSGNANVRAAHRMVNKARVRIDEAFLVINPKTGESDEVQHPGDPAGAPWNIINCHCVCLSETEGPKE